MNIYFLIFKMYEHSIFVQDIIEMLARNVSFKLVDGRGLGKSDWGEKLTFSRSGQGTEDEGRAHFLMKVL